jgi:hypothetical protein
MDGSSVDSHFPPMPRNNPYLENPFSPVDGNKPQVKNQNPQVG